MADTAALRFFTDTPDLTGLTIPDQPTAGDKLPTSRIQIAKVGTFRHPRTGKVTITAGTFDRMVQNFRAGIPNDRLPVDFDHEPDYGGSTKACGWITQLDHDSQALYATVEWTWQGAQSIKEGEYRYVSMAWTSAFVSDDLTKRGATLVGLALTNRPFLESMAPVSLSHRFNRDYSELAEEVASDSEGAADSRGRMSDLATFAKAVKLAEDAAEDKVLAAVTEAVTQAETFKTQVETLTTERDELKQEVDTFKASTTDAQKQATELATRVNSLEGEAKTTRFEQAFKAALDHKDGPRVAPAEKDELRELFDSNEKAFESVLAFRTSSLVPVKPTGERGEVDDGEAPKGVDAEAYALDRKVQIFMREHPDKDYAAALSAVQAQEK